MAKAQTITITLPEGFEYTSHVNGQDIPVDVANMHNDGLLKIFTYGGRVFNDRVNKFDKEDRAEAAAGLVAEFMEGKVKASRTRGGGMSTEDAIRKQVTRQLALNLIVAALKNEGNEDATQKTAREAYSAEQIEAVRAKVAANDDYAEQIEAKVQERLAKQDAEADTDAPSLGDLGL